MYRSNAQTTSKKIQKYETRIVYRQLLAIHKTSMKHENANVSVVFGKNVQNLKQWWNNNYTLFAIRRKFVYCVCKNWKQKSCKYHPCAQNVQTVTGKCDFPLFS